jgi:NADH dehydrogenase/NADH:ubiquinone oxidoreductase subunit G
LIWDGADLETGRSFAQALSGVAELSTYITGEQSNARGAEAMGMLPATGPGYVSVDPGHDTFAMLDDARNGNLAVLSILGANPVRNAPAGANVADALKAVPFLAVSELFMTETAQLATLVLPAKGAFEKSGTTVNMSGDVLPVNQSLHPPEFALSDFEMLALLADHLDVTLPSIEELDGTVIAHAAKMPEHFSFGDDRFGGGGSPFDSAQGDTGLGRDERRRTILSGGGTWLHDPLVASLRDSVTPNGSDVSRNGPNGTLSGVEG